jgi:hypothetical protein
VAADGATAIAAKGLSNIRPHHGDAADVIGWLPAGSLARVDLIYIRILGPNGGTGSGA